MNDRELFDYAAKAAGIDLIFIGNEPYEVTEDWSGDPNESPQQREVCWNPIIDDGDALRLAVKLELQVRINDYDTMVGTRLPLHITCAEKHNNDPYAATRRAIVRAAAEMGGAKGEK